MPRAVPRDPIYRRRRYSPEIIELCVRWYLTYRLSYRDLVTMMAERGVAVSHTTILRWVLRYVPEYERRWARFAQPINSSWRMDETAVSVRGGRRYLYRAVDRYGKSVHSLLCRDRSLESAQAFFRGAVAVEGASWPTKINLDGNAATHRALRMLGDEDPRWQSVEIRACRYLNNIVEQDHRAIKRRCVSMLGLKSYRSAATTFAGIELAHRIRKGQFSMPVEVQGRTSTLKDLWNRALDRSSGRQDRAVAKFLQCTRSQQSGVPEALRGSRDPAGVDVHERYFSDEASIYWSCRKADSTGGTAIGMAERIKRSHWVPFRTCRPSVRERDTKQHANGSPPELTRPSNDGNCDVLRSNADKHRCWCSVIQFFLFAAFGEAQVQVATR